MNTSSVDFNNIERCMAGMEYCVKQRSSYITNVRGNNNIVQFNIPVTVVVAVLLSLFYLYSEASQADIRQLVEGADALLNLAAVATSLASQRHLTENVGSSAPPHSSAPSSCQNVPRLHHSPATPHLGRVHILKPSAGRSATGKNGSKTKSEMAHNNNTIMTNNNKVLKVKRFSSRASSRQQLSSSSH